jgi:hypothetical protein
MVTELPQDASHLPVLKTPSACATPMGPAAAPAAGPTPAWAKAVQDALGWQESYSVDDQQLEMDVANAHFPKGPSEDFWFAHASFFQEAPGGLVAANGDFTVTAEEIARCFPH